MFKKILKKDLKIYVPPVDSHKGDNGRLLIIAGSDKYHGALLMCAATASKLVDFVYIYTTTDNFEIIKKIREKLAEFIYISKKDLKETIKEVDAVLIGPGLLPDRKTKKILKNILLNYPDKKILIDAGALRVLNKSWLHKNCILTPHKHEYKILFGEYPDPKNIKIISKNCPALIVIKGSVDYICQLGECFEHAGGNAGMTKGGTGDILSGLLAGLLTKNNTLTSAKIAVYINKKAGESLFKELGYFYSATDLIGSIQKELKNII